MNGYVIYNPETDQIYHPADGWLSAKGPYLRVYDLQDCIRWTEEEFWPYPTEIHRVTVTTEKVDDSTLDAERLAVVMSHIDKLPAFVQDMLQDMLGEVTKEIQAEQVLEQYFVASDSDPGKDYVVTLDGNREWACECGDFRFRRKKRGEICKHIRRVANSHYVKPGGVAPYGVRRYK